MTQIQYMMMVTDVHADYGYNKIIKKPQETTDTSALNLEETSVHLSRARRQ